MVNGNSVIPAYPSVIPGLIGDPGSLSFLFPSFAGPAYPERRAVGRVSPELVEGRNPTIPNPDHRPAVG